MATSNIGNNLLNSLLQQVGGLTKSATRTILNAMWPRDFELYMVSLELTNYKDELLDYMTFPVNPESMQKTESQVKNITRAANAIIVNSSDMFVPQDIHIKGNFGKSFKVLLRSSGVSDSFSAIVSKTDSDSSAGELSPFFKSGYGCLKVLQDICSRSSKKDDGRSRRLYFHNFMLGESYLVEVMSMQEDMSMSSNMIWGYDLSLKVLSPINLSKTKRGSLTVTGLLQNTITSVAGSCLNAISTTDWF